MTILGTGAAQLDILFQISSVRTLVFDFGIDVSAWTFEFYVKTNKGARIKTLSLTSGSGISFVTYSTSQIQVSFSATNTNLNEAEYYYELRRTDIAVPIINGRAVFSYDAPQGTNESSSQAFNYGTQTINLSISNVLSVLAASQSETDAGTVTDKYVNPKTLATKALKSGTYATTLNFSTDQDIFKDATGLSITFTLGATNVNGVGIVLRLNKPTAVTFPANFEATASSETLSTTKMNVFTLVYFSNWNGTGTARVVYQNATFTAV